MAHLAHLGGAAYVFLENLSQLEDATAVMQEETGVESVWTRAGAAEQFQLYPDRIGDLFVLATRETVFGDLPSPRQPVSVRSHGGLHTRSVPIIAHGPSVPAKPFTHNYQAASWIRWE